MKLTTKERWQDEARLYMLEKSAYYTPNDNVYEYGFYDGFQVQNDKIEQAINLIQKARSSASPDAILQDAILMLLKPLAPKNYSPKQTK